MEQANYTFLLGFEEWQTRRLNNKIMVYNKRYIKYISNSVN